MKHGLEIMVLALVDVYANSCMMLRAHQTPSTGELKLRNMTLVQQLHSGHQALQEGIFEGHRYCCC